MSDRVNRVLCAAEPRGSAEAIERLGAAASEAGVDAICVIGDLAGDAGSTSDYRAVFQALGKIGLPAYWVPGPNDAPMSTYLREAYNMEIAFPFLHGLHGTAAMTPDGHVVVAGFGGEIHDEPDSPRDETEHLSYPRWEPEYRFKVLQEMDEHMLALMFATPPAHRGDEGEGSEAVTELVGTYRPRVAFCGGDQKTELIGRTLVVAPGSLRDGHYAVVDVHKREAEFGRLH